MLTAAVVLGLLSAIVADGWPFEVDILMTVDEEVVGGFSVVTWKVVGFPVFVVVALVEAITFTLLATVRGTIRFAAVTESMASTSNPVCLNSLLVAVESVVILPVVVLPVVVRPAVVVVVVGMLVVMVLGMLVVVLGMLVVVLGTLLVVLGILVVVVLGILVVVVLGILVVVTGILVVVVLGTLVVVVVVVVVVLGILVVVVVVVVEVVTGGARVVVLAAISAAPPINAESMPLVSKRPRPESFIGS